jgi:hypothetical protein
VHPAKVSKYCVAVAALHPELPSNPWHQTLHAGSCCGRWPRVVAVAALAGCGTTTPRPQPVFSSTAGEVGPGTLVMLIRHGEKPAGSGSGPGIDVHGNESDSSMTATGWARARELVDLFDPAPGLPGRGWPARTRSMPRARPARVEACGPARPSGRWPTGSASR